MRRSLTVRVLVMVAVALGACAMWIAKSGLATASQGEAVLAGTFNTATAATVVSNTTGGADCSGYDEHVGLVGCADRVGIRGSGDTAIEGIAATNGGGTNGVYGVGDTAIAGSGGATGGSFSGETVGVSATAAYQGQNGGVGVSAIGAEGVLGNGSVVGVHGVGGEAGVLGVLSPIGVEGFGSDVGVLASSSQQDRTGVGLRVDGRSVFRTAGVATVPAGRAKVVVPLAGVTASDFVIATSQGATALSVKSAIAGKDKLTVLLSATAAADVRVGYFVISVG
jgi:hypothetical protein